MTGVDVHRMQRQGRILIPLMVIVLLVLGFLTARNLWRTASRPPPFTYSSDVYYPLAPACPGGVLQWRSEFTLNRGKFNTIRIARVVYDVQAGLIVAPDHQLDYYVWTETEWGKPQAGVISFPLPPELPPGLYEVRVGAAASGTEDTGYKVPFVIPVNCGKSEVKK